MDTKTRPIYMLTTRDSFKTHTESKWEHGKRYVMQMEIKRKPGQKYLYQTKQTKIKTVTWDKGHYIVKKGSIQEDITIVNIYAPNIGVPKYIKQILTDIKGEN